MQCPDPGVYRDVPATTYHSWEAVHSSLLKTIREETCATARYQQLNPKDQTEAMAEGEAVHLALLEPHRFDENFARGLDMDRRSAKRKALHAAHELDNLGKTVLRHNSFEMVKGMAEAVQRHARTMELLTAPGLNEVSIVTNIEASNGLALPCKIRCDRLTRFQKWNAIVDVKTKIGSLSDEAIRREIGDRKYHIQAAFYLDVAEALQPAARRFFWVFVSKQRPYLSRVFEADAEQLWHGRNEWRWAFNDWARCIASDRYPGWDDDIVSVGLDRWHTTSDAESERRLESGDSEHDTIE